jgi:hypothetical protein
MHRKYIFILVILLGIAPTACIAQTWDATKDFGPSNPNGAWSYGWGVTGTSFTLYTIYYSDCAPVSGFICWTADLYPHLPVVGFNTTGQWLHWLTNVVTPDALFVQEAPDWDPGDSIVQWTAPSTATYRVSGFFEILDTNPSGIIGLVYRNGTLLFRAELLGPPAQYPDQIGGRANFYFPQLSLNKGDVISFGLNADGTFYYDGTGFNATITTPPTAPPCAVCSQ